MVIDLANINNSTGGSKTEPVSVKYTSNGDYTITPSADADAISKATVTVDVQATLTDSADKKYAYWDLTNIPEDFTFVARTDVTHLFEGAKNYDAIADKVAAMSANTKDYESTFAGCDATTITTPSITDNSTIKTNYQSTFENCTATEIIVNSDWSSTNIYRNYKNFLSGCKNLQRFKVSSVHLARPGQWLDYEGMYKNCENLEAMLYNQFNNPIAWTGLADNYTGATDPASYRSVFENCYKMCYWPATIYFTHKNAYVDPDASKAFYLAGSQASNPGSIKLVRFDNMERADWCFYGAKFTSITIGNSTYPLAALLYANHFCDSIVGLTTHPVITSKIKEADYAFQNCTSLKAGIDWDFSDLETAKGMYKGCTSLMSCTLSTIGDYDTPHLRDISEMFSGCTSLVQIPAFDCSYVQDATDVVKDCTSLQLLNQGGFKNLHCDLDLSTATAITAESLVNLISVLGTVSGKTLTLGDTNKAKLTADQIAVATAKGWTVA